LETCVGNDYLRDQTSLWKVFGLKDTGAFEPPYDVQELKKIYQKLAETYGKTRAQEQFAKHVLTLLGFTHITKRPRGYDFDAERHQRRYAVEVKGRGIPIQWHQLKELWWAKIDEVTPMVMFVNPDAEWFLCELKDGIVSPPHNLPKPTWQRAC
jgi:hypothetical protein